MAPSSHSWRNTPLAPGDLVDEKAAAEILGVSTQTLRNWRSERRGPAFRHVGRLVRYHRMELTAFTVEDDGREVA